MSMFSWEWLAARRNERYDKVIKKLEEDIDIWVKLGKFRYREFYHTENWWNKTNEKMII